MHGITEEYRLKLARLIRLGAGPTQNVLDLVGVKIRTGIADIRQRLTGNNRVVHEHAHAAHHEKFRQAFDAEEGVHRAATPIHALIQTGDRPLIGGAAITPRDVVHPLEDRIANAIDGRLGETRHRSQPLAGLKVIGVFTAGEAFEVLVAELLAAPVRQPPLLPVRNSWSASSGADCR